MTFRKLTSTFDRRSMLKASIAGAGAFSLVRPSFGQVATPSATPEGTFVPQTGIEREEIVVAVQGLPRTMDPAMALSNVGSRVVWTPYDTLIRRDFLNDNVNVPHLATSWEFVEETILELKLRTDVTFHNGDAFSADDVLFTFDRIMNPGDDADLVEAGTYFATVSEIEKVDDYTVRFHTFEPDPVIVNRLASWAGWIVPKNHIETVGVDEFRNNGMGTGPYRIASFVPDTEVVLERYDGFWGILPPAKRVVFRVIPEVAARVTALINGEVDIITNIPPDQLETLQSAEHVEVRDIVLSNVHVLRYNCRKAPFDDKKFRQGLNLGIDRQLIVDAIWGGKARMKRGHQFPEYGYLFNEDRPYTPYDQEAARKLIEESSYEGQPINYEYQPGYYTLSDQVALAIVEMWQEIGVNAQVLAFDTPPATEEREVATWSNSSLLADPEGSLVRLWGPGSAVQANYWDAPAEFNETIMIGRTSLDEQTRFDAYQKVMDIWDDEAPGTVLYDGAEYYGVNKSINWNPYPVYNMDLRHYNLSFNE